MGDTDTNLQLGLGLGEHYSASQSSKKDDRFNKKLPSGSFELQFPSIFTEDDNNLAMKASIEDQEQEGKDCDASKKSHDQNNGCRKKLKLTENQTSTLETYFNSNSTLSPAKKLDLAEQLNLKPRQVEVWFQNRRARTKVKQTEEDYEMLKKCCENLKSENRKLRKELQELRSTEPEFMHFSSFRHF